MGGGLPQFWGAVFRSRVPYPAGRFDRPAHPLGGAGKAIPVRRSGTAAARRTRVASGGGVRSQGQLRLVDVVSPAEQAQVVQGRWNRPGHGDGCDGASRSRAPATVASGGDERALRTAPFPHRPAHVRGDMTRARVAPVPERVIPRGFAVAASFFRSTSCSSRASARSTIAAGSPLGISLRSRSWKPPQRVVGGLPDRELHAVTARVTTEPPPRAAGLEGRRSSEQGTASGAAHTGGDASWLELLVSGAAAADRQSPNRRRDVRPRSELGDQDLDLSLAATAGLLQDGLVVLGGEMAPQHAGWRSCSANRR